jgi:hypothetical protein
MKTFINLLLKLFSVLESKVYIEIGRNEKCYCGSEKKFKNCHLTYLQKKGKIALYVIDKKSREKSIKIYSKYKYKGITSRVQTQLTGSQVRATNIALNDYNEKIHSIYQ